MFCPVFTTTDSEDGEIKLGDLTLLGSAGNGDDYIQLITTGGSLGNRHVWIDGMMAALLNNGVAGWTKADYTGMADTQEFPEGTGFYVKASNGNVKIMSSGNVRLTSLTLTLGLGYSIIGNSTPNKIFLGDIKLDGSDGAGNDYIQLITTGGSLGDRYVWIDGMMAALLNNGVAGWAKADYTGMADEIEIEPGEGLYIKAASNNVKLTLPPGLATE